MAHRGDRDDRYSAWRRENRNALTASGMPDRLVDDDKAFWFAVQEGEGYGALAWSSDWLNPDEARALYDLLSGFLDEGGGWSLLPDLKRRANGDR